ncbi:putative N6-adenine methyltransferase-domain-containing protein [Cladochytrium replicatum]|nr:putative N6-adenine methyltransferase-domain-containing protein [Cladochytrium replicatum]
MQNNNDEDDDDLKLNPDTLAALQDFMREKKEQEDQFERLKQLTHKKADAAKELAENEAKLLTQMSIFKEDWQLSQFWYDEDTAQKLAQEAIANTPEGGWIACISSPTAFVELKRINPTNINYVVFEYDRRFEVFGLQFFFYDYNHPEKFETPDGSRPQDWAGRFDYIIVDPPFLAEDCFKKTAQTVRLLLKKPAQPSQPSTTPAKPAPPQNSCAKLPEPPKTVRDEEKEVDEDDSDTPESPNEGTPTPEFRSDPNPNDAAKSKKKKKNKKRSKKKKAGEGGKILVCTGAVMEPVVLREVGAKRTRFFPRHKGRLSNEFRSYTNYESTNVVFSWIEMNK